MRILAVMLAAALLAPALAGPAGADQPEETGSDPRDRREDAAQRAREAGKARAEAEREGEDDEGRDDHGERGDRREALAKLRALAFAKSHDKWVLRNDDITIWFHQGDRSKPALAVFRTGEDGNRSGFRVVLDELFEVAPRDAASHDGDDDLEEDDDAPAFQRVRGHRVNLHPAREWWTDVQNGTEEVTVTMRHLFNQGNVTLVFHVPLDGAAVKFDVLVEDWDWADANHTLALRMKVQERHAERDGDDDAASFAGGYVTWAPTAQVTYPDGSVATIPVEAVVRNHEESARIVLWFNGTGGYAKLDYDPTFGIQGAGMQQVPALGALAALGAAAAVALAWRRREP